MSNPLFDLVVISPQCPYNPYDQPSVPLELYDCTSQIPPHQLFPHMDSEGEIPTSPQGHSKVYVTHTHVDDEKGHEFPLEGFLFIGRVPSHMFPETSGLMFPRGYTTLAQLVSETPSASSLHKNPIWSSNAMPTTGLFIPNVTSQIYVQTSVTPVPVQPTIPSKLVPLFQTYISVQLIVSGQVSTSFSTPLSSGHNVPLLGGKNPIIPLMSSGTRVSGSQPHMVGVNQTYSGHIPNPVVIDLFGNFNPNQTCP